jgi:hypothetical protein
MIHHCFPFPRFVFSLTTAPEPARRREYKNREHRRIRMIYRIARLALLLGVVALVAGGCRGCLRENIVWEHTFNHPDCRSRPCPRECPEFELPPGGPYMTTPDATPARPAPVKYTVPETREK